MKKLLLVCFFSTLFGAQAYASGCSDMAKFNTTVDEFLKTASLSQSLKNNLDELKTECQTMHNMGMDVATATACKKALQLVQVN